jgi:hypothetical protein
MIDTPHPMNKQSLPAAPRPRWRALGTGPVFLLMAFGAGLLLGSLSNYWVWQWLENPWPFFGLLCPPLLGLVAGLLADDHCRYAWLRVLVASLLTWSGFILTFLVIAHLHWDQEVFTYMPTPPPEDPYCSPCLDFTPPPIWFSLQDFFVLGLMFVVSTALATNFVVKVVRWYSPRRPTLSSHSS